MEVLSGYRTSLQLHQRAGSRATHSNGALPPIRLPAFFATQLCKQQRKWCNSGVLPTAHGCSSPERTRVSLRPTCALAPGQHDGMLAERLPASAPAAGNGTFVLMLICVVGFVLDHVLHLPFMQALYLHNSQPQWYQFITHQFCHGSLQHLSSNLFQLCVFGRFVEETEGAAGVVFIYLITGLGAAAATTLLLRGGVSVGASGAIFGLFATSVLLRLTRGPSIKALLEAVVLGNFVVRQVMDEMRHQVMGGLSTQGMQVAHVAHLAGALMGVLLVLVLHRLPSGEEAGGKRAAV